ncbi:MAG: DUF2339 domain-containing protein, partial [Terracidiphilus sp.]
MELIALILLVVIAIVVMPIVAIAMTRSNSRELREEIATLSDRLRDAESKLYKLIAERAVLRPAADEQPVIPEAKQSQPPAEPALPPQQVPVESAAATLSLAPAVAPLRVAEPPKTQAPSPTPTPPPPAPAAAPPQSSSAAKFFSLEERFGANWLNKLGIAILVVGLAFFLAYKLRTMGPAGKVLCGFAVSLALLGGGVWLERRPTYRIFARAGIGGGWALAFFTTFAMHHIAAARILNSLPADLVLMLLVAAGMVAHSLRYRSQTVTGLAFLLGFVTLLTSHLQAASGTIVFSLTASAILAVALVVVTTRRHWAALELAGLAAIYLTHFVWLTRVMPTNRAAFADFWPSTALIVLYWLIFRLAYVFRTPLNASEENLSSLAAVLNSGGVLALLKYQAAHPEWACWALAALGAAEMALAFR